MLISLPLFQKIGTIGISENKAKLSLASSTAVYENVPKTREMILVSQRSLFLNFVLLVG